MKLLADTNVELYNQICGKAEAITRRKLNMGPIAHKFSSSSSNVGAGGIISHSSDEKEYKDDTATAQNKSSSAQLQNDKYGKDGNAVRIKKSTRLLERNSRLVQQMETPSQEPYLDTSLYVPDSGGGTPNRIKSSEK